LTYDLFYVNKFHFKSGKDSNTLDKKFY